MQRRLGFLFAFLALGSFASARPASAEWTRIADVPATDVFSVFARGDTLFAGTDSVVHVSTDAGATWRVSAPLDDDVLSVDALWLAGGAIYAGTYGWGVFASADFGASWVPLSAGLANAGPGGMHVVDFQQLGDSLYAATDGAGVRVLNLREPLAWQPFGGVPQAAQAGGVLDLALGGTRLMAAGGGNGSVFWRDPGMPDWSETFLNNAGLEPGLQPFSLASTGPHWFVATSGGLFRSASGAGGWAPVGPNLGLTQEGHFARYGATLFAAINDPFVHFFATYDDGDDWELLETAPAFAYELAVTGTRLLAARSDGLWQRPVPTASVPPPRPGLGFALDGPHPVRGEARFRFTLGAAARVTLDVFDVSGRRLARLLDHELAAGAHTATWRETSAPAGVYLARLTAEGRGAALRFVKLD